MKVITCKEDMILETNGVCAEGMDIEKLGFIIQAIPLDRIKQARRELDELRFYGAKFTDGYKILIDKGGSILNYR